MVTLRNFRSSCLRALSSRYGSIGSPYRHWVPLRGPSCNCPIVGHSPGFNCIGPRPDLSAPKSQRFLRLRCPSRTPEIARFPRQETAMMHCDLRVRWKDASDLRFRAAISEPETPSFCGISGDLAPSTRKSLAIAIVRFWCAKGWT